MNIKEKNAKATLFPFISCISNSVSFVLVGEPLEANKAHVIRIHIISRLGVLIIYDMLKIQTDRQAKRGDNKSSFFSKVVNLKIPMPILICSSSFRKTQDGFS